MFVLSLNEATDLFPSIYEHSVYNSSRWSQKRLYVGESLRLSYGFLHFYFRRILHISSHSTAFCILVLVRCSCLLSLDRLAHDIGWRMAPILWCTWLLRRVKKIPPYNISLGLRIRAWSPWVWFQRSLNDLANIDSRVQRHVKCMELFVEGFKILKPKANYFPTTDYFSSTFTSLAIYAMKVRVKK